MARTFRFRFPFLVGAPVFCAGHFRDNHVRSYRILDSPFPRALLSPTSLAPEGVPSQRDLLPADDQAIWERLASKTFAQTTVEGRRE
jgi:hypothetical protein